MYHYVGDGDSTPPYGYYHLDVNDFRRQLDYFETNYQILDQDEFLDTVRGERSPKEDDLVLTFDDGLSDHHEYVLPELVDRELWGLFYVPVGPYTDDIVLDVHRTHALLGAHGGAAVSEALSDIMTEEMISEVHRDQFESIVYESQDNRHPVERVKQILNYYIDDGVRSSVLDTLEHRLFTDLLRPEDVYMSETEVRDLVDAGMHVGSHSITHTVMSKLPKESQRHEIAESFRFLSDLLGDFPIRSYCHPYGGEHSYTDETLSILDAAGCLFGFDVDSRPITAAVLRDERYHLPRYDCNEFRYGDATVSLG